VRDAVIANENGITGLGVPSLSTLARAYLERPEPPQFNDPIAQKSGFDLIEEQIYDPVDVLLADLDLRVNAFDDLGLGKFFPGHDVGPATLSAR
jgi:hypothetical protein